MVRVNRSSEHTRNAERLWNEHRRAPFPTGLRGAELAGTDMVLLDTETTGCVFTWLNNGGILDPERSRVLQGCVEALNRVVPEIAEHAGAQYYQRLRRLALLASETPQAPDEATSHTAHAVRPDQ